MADPRFGGILIYLYLIIFQYCSLYHFDPLLLQAMIQVESNFHETAVGTHGEVGLLQLTPKVVGVSKERLKDPATNLINGLILIKKIRAECKFKEDNEWLVCFNQGSPKGNKIKYPKKNAYYKRVMKVLKEHE